MSIITLLTDFTELYPASMKAAILTIAPQATIIDITHSIPPQNIKWGAAALSFTAPYFPDNTVHVAVVDPGVGSKRKCIAIKTTGKTTQYFVGPDNGLLIPAAKAVGSFEVFEINTEPFEKASATFHGRDIFAPIGAELSLGRDIHKIGTRLNDFVELPAKPPVISKNTLAGEILFIDSFGNIITNIPSDMAFKFMKHGDTLQLSGQELTFNQTYSDVEPATPLVLIGSHGFLEVSINNGNAKNRFNFKIDDLVTLTKHDSKRTT